MDMKIVVLGVFSVSLLFFGCANSGGDVCAPNTTALCNCTATVVGVQSCNSDGSGYSPCQCEGIDATPEIDAGATDVSVEETDAVPEDQDICEPYNFKDCIGDEIWYFDSCGKKQELVNTCGAPATCVNGACSGTCEPNHHTECNEEGDAVYWVDSCGVQGGLVTECPAGTACVNAQCISACTPHEYQDCHNGQVYWFDACDEPESVAEICDDEQFCANANCVKPYYDGQWKMVANPNQKDACGLGSSTYPPQTLNLTIEGGVATASLEVIGISVNYTGTVVGKTLELTGEWDQVDNTLGLETVTHHEETISVEFTSPSTFEGTHIDKFSLDLGASLGGEVECTLYWIITAEKQ